MNQSNKALRDNHRPLCNCDGFWHVSIKDKDGDWVSHYVDISPVTNHIKERMPKQKKPSDSKFHNKWHKPEPTPPHKCESEDCEHYVAVPPKAVRTMLNFNDGYNQAIKEFETILEEVSNEK